ncbi:hypothetical protein [Sphingosinicella rhizophila]|uniref:Lipoprotein n=1 Tax=Sphingosinicella rhizophila TaxID=3050082 RepID=A0ABU3QC50_9SPHN|nr:hypothetical protein [Sphingosinicella sp. GR2756]MDT9600980.1 hypothetical protein [Sphingosinicella sp. GR2756]
MKLVYSLSAAMAAFALTACQEDRIENIQTEAENQSQRLEARANEIIAEAENSSDATATTLENEAAALLNQTGPAAATNQSQTTNSAR